MNLLKETESALATFGLQARDVVWVGSKDGRFAIPWKNFKEIADIEYVPEPGVVKVAKDLVVAGANWWMERTCNEKHVEAWAFKSEPWRWLSSRPFKNVLCSEVNFSGEIDDNDVVTYDTVSSLNGGEVA